MKVNHEETRSRILQILDIIKEHGNTTDKYKKDLLEVNQDRVYSQEVKNERINNLEVTYRNAFENIKVQLLPLIDEVEELENQNEKITEYDVPEFAATVAAINAARAKLPRDVITGIIENFSGQYKALQTIHAIFKSYEPDSEIPSVTDKLFSDYISVTNGILKLRKCYEKLEQSKDTSFLTLNNLFNETVHFAETHSIKLEDYQKDTGDIISAGASQERTARMEHVMGIK